MQTRTLSTSLELWKDALAVKGPEMGAVHIRHCIQEIATQPVILWIIYTAGWQAKMASIELWIQ